MAKANLKNAAFKVGDEVVCTSRPFELHEIIKQVPGSRECQYRIGPPSIRSQDGKVIKASARGEQRDVGENQLLTLDDTLNGLIEAGGLPSNETAKHDVLLTLSLAKKVAASEQRTVSNRIPKKIAKKLITSLENTIGLLAEIADYTDDLCVQVYMTASRPAPKEEGQYAPKREAPSAHSVTVRNLENQADETFTLIDVRKLLKAYLDSVKRAPKKKQGDPRPDKTALMEVAFEFFQRYRPGHGHTSKEFTSFSDRFYEVVTGIEPNDLGHQRRQLVGRSRRTRSKRAAL